MSSPLDRPLRIEFRLPSNHPRLLEGLELWLELGLISDAQVRQICRQYFVCDVVLHPQTEVKPQATQTPKPTTRPLIAYLPSEPEAPPEPRQTQPKQTQPNLVGSVLQSLGEELSVRWFLFLGLFLVILCSGALAASQWQRFPAVGQYGVLLAYTLGFAGFTSWSGKQSNLRLTAQTILMATLLLVPINFWAMDGFGLWRNPANWVIMTIAAVMLSVITNFLYHNRTVSSNFPSGKLPLINLLALSFLHWGWNIPTFPVIAIYLAMIGTTAITVYKNGYQSPIPASSEPNTDAQFPRWNAGLYLGVVISALLTLLARAIFVAGVNITQLGLAMGICGWLLAWLAEKNLTTYSSPQAEGVSENSSPSVPSPPSSLEWEKLGGVLIFLGWLMSVFTQPAQAIGVSALGLWFFGRRLERNSLQIDFTAVFFIGLQTIWLGWRLIPAVSQELIVNTATSLTNSQNHPWALLSIAFFPYIPVMLTLTSRFYRQNKRDLADFGELLTLLWGICLTVIGIVNPSIRSLNLLFSTICLAVVCKRRASSPDPLVYLTHITAVVTVCSAIQWAFPNLSREIWAGILLTLMVAEWIFSLGEGIWKRSAWYVGLGLATLSFAPLWMNVENYWFGELESKSNWGALWSITPVTLTFLAHRTTREERKNNTVISIGMMLIAQLLTLPLPTTRLIGLGVGLVVMFINSRYLRNQLTAGLTIGFGLGLIASLLWNFTNLAISGWLIVLAVTTLSLWIGQKVLLQRNHDLANFYGLASDKWAMTLCTVELLLMTIHSSLIYQGYGQVAFFQSYAQAGVLYLVATAITLVAIIYRSWGQPTDIAFYSVGWCLELLTAEVLGFGESSIIKVAIANIALGLATQIFGEWWRRRFQLATLPNSFHILPLIYGAISIVLRVYTFTEWTGLASLGIALIFIGVGRRKAGFKPLVYLGIIGISFSAYELLFYQMLQASGGVIGDGLIAMAALGTSIMYVYRLFTRWLINYFNLSRGELTAIAHIHWAWSSILFIVALTVPVKLNFWLGLGTAIFLARYAIFQGRTQTTDDTPVTTTWGMTSDEIWVYLGLIEFASLTIYFRNLPVAAAILQQILPWQTAIACVFGYFIYILPWQNWGWSKTPWQRTAYIIPAISLWSTRTLVSSITLVLTAAYYGFLAKFAANLRFTYISIALVDWALFRWFQQLGFTDSLFYVLPLGLSLLYIAQVDEPLQRRESKDIRHILRLLAIGLICGWPVISHQNLPFIPGIFSLIAIFAGLGLRVRAYLYVGSIAFLTTSIYQLVILGFRYPLLKWLIGILVGITLIYIAANFETRRHQINSLIRSRSNDLQDWE